MDTVESDYRQARSGNPIGVAVAAALLAGVTLCMLLPQLPPWPWLALAFACGTGGWLRGGRWVALGACLVGFGLAGLHAASTLAQQLPVTLELQEMSVSGRVLELPKHEVRRTRFILRVDHNASQVFALRGKRLQLAWYDDFDAPPGMADAPRLQITAGSHWRLRVKLKAPRGLRNPGGFDSEKYALMQRIAATGYVRDPELARQLAPAQGIDAWRERMSVRIARAVPSPSSRFVRALALGDTRALDDADWEILRAAGLTHLIAISGFHVGLVAGFFALFATGLWWTWPSLARVVPRPQAAAVSALAGALLYAAAAGFALPTVRTVLMVGVLASARCSRRALRTLDAVALAVMAVLLVDPLAILGAGFWLSFAGVLWLLWCLPQGASRPLRDFLPAQIVATIGLLPFTVLLFGQASLAGPFANLLAIPWWSLVVVPMALIGTALDTLHAGTGEWAWRLAAQAFDPSWSLFAWLAHGGLALCWLPEPRWFALPMGLLGAFWMLLPRGVPGKWLALLLWLPLLWPSHELPKRGEVELVVIDVGQGLSLLVRTARHSLLYDMGPAVADGFDAGERAVVPALHALGVTRLDAAVISHGDNDHAGGFAAVRRVFAIARSYAPAGSGVDSTHGCVTEQAWRWDGVSFRFLHPPPEFPYLGNEAGCVLRIESAHGALLLMADVGEVIEQRLLNQDRAALRAAVVVVGHHGSGGSSDAEFVAATGAAVAAVSAGYGNRFRHPRPEVVERWQRAGARVPVTLQGGALRIRIDAAGVAWRADRSRHTRLWDAVRRQVRARQLSYRPD